MPVNWRTVPALLGAAAIATFTVLAGPSDWFRGLSLDGTFLLRSQLFDRPDPTDSPVALVALDEETYRRAPFRGTPKALWTPEMGLVLEAVLDGGAKVVGFDLILPTSVEAHLPGHDYPLLLALRRAGQADRVVLARVQHQSKPINPFPGLAIAAGRGDNIRLANVFSDPDGVVRQVPMWFRMAEPKSAWEPGFALEIAARYMDVVPGRTDEGRVELGGTSVRGVKKEEGLLLNFRAGSSAFPTHSLADLHACATAGKTDFFRQAFAGKIVLFGGVLDAEDRLLTSKRFISGAEGDRPAARCVLPVLDDLFLRDVRRRVIPGVVVQATAIENLVRNEGLARLGSVAEVVLVLVLAFVCAWVFQRFSIGWSVGGLLAFGMSWTIAAAYVLRDGLVLPGLTLAVVLAATAAMSVAYRYFVADRDRRAIRRFFSLYLSPPVVDRLLASGEVPVVGGERREVTILVSDIAGYTAMSENLPPERVVDLVNRYFEVGAGAIERHGGFVDKFMGDGMLAVFGAPLADPDHAGHAVAAAVELQRLTTAESELVRPDDGTPLRTRIGIATGPVLIGNVGSGTRLNYTVIGDTVNLAARLEVENKAHGTSVLVAQDTARAVGLDAFDLVGSVRVRGRDAEVVVYTPKRSPLRAAGSSVGTSCPTTGSTPSADW